MPQRRAGQIRGGPALGQRRRPRNGPRMRDQQVVKALQDAWYLFGRIVRQSGGDVTAPATADAREVQERSPSSPRWASSCRGSARPRWITGGRNTSVRLQVRGRSPHQADYTADERASLLASAPSDSTSVPAT